MLTHLGGLALLAFTFVPPPPAHPAAPTPQRIRAAVAPRPPPLPKSAARSPQQRPCVSCPTRPPSEASACPTTYHALRGLRTFGTREQQPRVTARTAKALRWLRSARAADTEGRVFRLRALCLAGAADAEVRAAAQELARSQRS